MRPLLCALVLAFGCGGGGSGGGDDDDTPNDGSVVVIVDGPSTDGPTNTSSPLGTTCTPDANNPQGSCPTGFQCLNLQGATNPWCSETCTTGAGDTCGASYGGPGRAACIMTVTDMNGQNPQNFCAVICEDLTGNNGVCQAGQCNGTCPGTLACTSPIQNTGQGGGTIGNACE